MGKDDRIALSIAAYDDPDAAHGDCDALKALMKEGRDLRRRGYPVDVATGLVG